MTVVEDRLAQYAGITVKMPLPRGIRDGGRWRSARLIVFIREQTPQQGSHAQGREKVVGHHDALGHERFAPRPRRDAIQALVSEDIGKAVAVLPQAREDRVRDGVAVGTRPVARVDTSVEVADLGVHTGPAQHTQFVRIGHRQRTQKNTVNEREDRRTGPDPQRQ